jgi:hypothetical protein
MQDDLPLSRKGRIYQGIGKRIRLHGDSAWISCNSIVSALAYTVLYVGAFCYSHSPSLFLCQKLLMNEKFVLHS